MLHDYKLIQNIWCRKLTLKKTPVKKSFVLNPTQMYGNALLSFNDRDQFRRLNITLSLLNMLNTSYINLIWTYVNTTSLLNTTTLPVIDYNANAKKISPFNTIIKFL